jgi:hypothetical protein
VFKGYLDRIQNSRFLSFWAVIWELLILGPFAIPMLWLSPRFNRFWKIILSLAVILIAVILTKFSADLIKTLNAQLSEIGRNAS